MSLFKLGPKKLPALLALARFRASDHKEPPPDDFAELVGPDSTWMELVQNGGQIKTAQEFGQCAQKGENLGELKWINDAALVHHMNKKYRNEGVKDLFTKLTSTADYHLGDQMAQLYIETAKICNLPGVGASAYVPA
jgi:hypothetical protein